MDGNCAEELTNDIQVNDTAQLIFTSNRLDIPAHYLGMLDDNLGQFSAV